MSSDYQFLIAYIASLREGKRSNFVLPKGKSSEELTVLEASFDVTVPNELKEFYNFSYAPKLDEYQFLSVDKVKEFQIQLLATYRALHKESVLPFSRVVGTGDFIALDVNEIKAEGILILDGFHEIPPSEWTGICYGLRNWLERMVKSNFQPFWL